MSTGWFVFGAQQEEWKVLRLAMMCGLETVALKNAWGGRNKDLVTVSDQDSEIRGYPGQRMLKVEQRFIDAVNGNMERAGVTEEEGHREVESDDLLWWPLKGPAKNVIYSF